MPRDRPHLWDSFKRALTGSQRPDGIDRDYEPPPFLPPDEVDPTPAPAASAPVEARREVIAAETGPAVAEPLEPPAAELAAEPVAPARAPEARGEPPGTTSAAEAPAGRARLARGLASFSRDNADREKKYRHILSDGDSGKKKR